MSDSLFVLQAKMNAYTLNEYADMHLIYGECRCNAEEASRVYAERFPDRAHPYPQAFRRLDVRLRTENRLTPRSYGGRPIEVAQHVEEDMR